MKIGILTFHWSDNYGAVIQCYALQEYLKSQGHEVEIINYTPLKYSLFFSKLLLHPSQLKNFSLVKVQKQKHRFLKRFKLKNLCMSSRIFKHAAIESQALKYDAIISGSDQVLNASFLLYGENGHTPVYYLPYSSPKKIGYAVSFGCTSYPTEAIGYAKTLVNNFDIVGVREHTGMGVLNQLGYKGTCVVVPDPTILYGNHLFDRISLAPKKESYYCVYMLRSKISISCDGAVVYMDDSIKPVSMEEWISTIKYSKGLVTNSYHGMIMAILNRVPFVVILESGEVSGMNDRFYTLLDRLELKDRIHQYFSNRLIDSLEDSIDWATVESKISDYRRIGVDFLNNALTV